MPHLILLILLATFTTQTLQAQSDRPELRYLPYVQHFADTLLAYGLDTYGTVHTPFWAGLIDTRTYAVPSRSEAAATKGADGYYDRPTRRAVGGANLYHDLETLQVFRLLSAFTGEPRYAEAADAYVSEYLERAQNPHTGLIGWGEHLYYDFYDDTVTVGARPGQTGPVVHEFLAKTPIWTTLWKRDSVRTMAALEGLRYHFRGPVTQSYLFNRHAHWARVEEAGPHGMGQYQYGYGQPWIKHSALLAYSFAVLYDKTGASEWLDWALGVGNLYWRHRDPVTNLTVSCIDDPRPNAGSASLTGMTHLAYWLYRASEEAPALAELRERALTMFDAITTHAWQPDRHAYHTGPLNLDGTLLEPDASAEFHPYVGRVAAYFARHEEDDRYLTIARRMVVVMERDSLPDDFNAEALGARLHLLLDLYDLTKEEPYLSAAIAHADRGIRDLWRDGLFARRAGDPYYEAKDGIGYFASGLLRLQFRLHPNLEEPEDADWSL